MPASDSPNSDIIVKGAREHNLRDVHLVLPRNRLICFTGVSGSGKSSMAFDTLFAEGQRRYVESLSSYARQFLGQMPKPDVDQIVGLSPSISISQKTGGQNPRSTVGTITEIYDYLRVLYARVGKGHCPRCRRPITAQTREHIIQQILALPKDTEFMVLAPLIRGQRGEYRDLFEDLLKQGFARARVDGTVVRLSDDLQLDRQMRHNIELVVDRLTAGPEVRPRLAEAVELASRHGQGNLIIASEAGDKQFSVHYACTHCNISFEPPSPQLFSFNSPQGMCLECDGLGEIYGFDPERLIPDPGRSFQQGCFELIGSWRQMGRWRRHIYRGVAETLERHYELEQGTVLETAWEELDAVVQDALLYGTGDMHITYTWRRGTAGSKWGGDFEGIIPKLLGQYRNTKSRPQRRQLEKYMRVLGCGHCKGWRLNPQASAVTLESTSEKFQDRTELSLPEVCNLAVSNAEEFFSGLKLDRTGQAIAAEAIKEVRGRLRFLENVGLEYLTLSRTAPTLSGGEMQRIRLAGQIGCGLVGVFYILDEPSIGLHPRDNDRLLGTLGELRDQGNTVLVVEHDEDTMRAADHIVDFGPGPGVRGGKVVASGPLAQVMAEPHSITGRYLSGLEKIEVPLQRRPASDKQLVIRGAKHNN
ncbi:MAG: excinuclease ABC subunit UvrA, partial [Thermoguttaceae bacterium]